MNNEETKHILGVAPINKLMVSMGMPIIISMILQAFYNIVDSAFVSNMAQNGEQALNALTLAFPVQILIVAVGIGTGVGTNALLSKTLGGGDRKTASQIAGNSIFLGVIIYIVFLMFGLFCTGIYLKTQTSNSQIYSMAYEYLRICCVFSMGIIFFSVFEKLLQATGLSVYSTIAQIAGAVTNIVLDPVLIYGLLGSPKMGVRGAAYATVIGQVVSFLLALFFHFKFNKDIINGFKYIKPSAKLIKQIYAVGFPAIIAQALMSVMTYTLNIIFGSISEEMVTAYGLYYKIQQFVFFAAFGMRDAITPIVSFNHGKRDKGRILKGIKCGIGYTLVIMLTGIIVIETAAGKFSAVFGLSGTTQALFMGAMRIITLSFIFAGINIALQGIFQALNSGMESLVISVLRQFILVIPAASFFAVLARQSQDNSWLVWTAFPIAEILTAVVACILLKRIYYKKIKFIDNK